MIYIVAKIAVFFAKLSANTGPLFLVDSIFPYIRRIDMFVKPTQLIGKKKGIENRTNEEKGEKSEKEAKKQKTHRFNPKKGKQRKKKQSLDLFVH